MNIPKIGLLVCNSGSSNSGTLTGVAGMEVVKELGGDQGKNETIRREKVNLML